VVLDSVQWVKDKQVDMMNLVRAQEELHITMDKVVYQLKRVKNWKTHGHDAVHEYWLKYLTNIHLRKTNNLQEMFQKGPPS